MLKINRQKFDVKFSTIDIRQRMYQGSSIVTLMLDIDFYPEMVHDSIVYGGIKVKVDLDNVHSLKELEGKNYQGEIGNVLISVCNDGIWETKSIDDFSISFGKLNKRLLSFELKADEFYLKEKGTLVSLYTTSTSSEELGHVFDLDDFYSSSQKSDVGKSTILKYYVKSN